MVRNFDSKNDIICLNFIAAIMNRKRLLITLTLFCADRLWVGKPKLQIQKKKVNTKLRNIKILLIDFFGDILLID